MSVFHENFIASILNIILYNIFYLCLLVYVSIGKVKNLVETETFNSYYAAFCVISGLAASAMSISQADVSR